jgi:hypothetical protein
MLACKKCHDKLAERTAQQSLSEMETALLVRYSPISAHRKAMKYGPLCDRCLAGWQEKNKREVQPASFTDTRSPAMKRLGEACLALGKASA